MVLAEVSKVTIPPAVPTETEALSQWTFSNSLAAFCVIAFPVYLQLGGAAVVVFYLTIDPSEADHAIGLIRAVGIRLGGSALADTVIATSMTYYLLKSRKKAIGGMNHVLTRLIRLTIETGTVTALAAIIDLVFYLSQHNGLHQVSGIILGKLYTNTLLVLFNNCILSNKDLNKSEVMFSGNQSGQGSSMQHQQTMQDRSITVTIDSEETGSRMLR